MPGVPTAPSALRNGTTMPPAPERDSESVSAAAMSASVGFAQSASITVPGMTGLTPGISVKLPEPSRGIDALLPVLPLACLRGERTGQRTDGPCARSDSVRHLGRNLLRDGGRSSRPQE